MTSAYQKYTVASLKEELRERGPPISGNKSVLIERLIHDDNEQNQEEERFGMRKGQCRFLTPRTNEPKGHLVAIILQNGLLNPLLQHTKPSNQKQLCLLSLLGCTGCLVHRC